jgi:hypothetical protein
VRFFANSRLANGGPREADSPAAAADIVNGLPVVQQELWVFDINPVSSIARF